jgi:putative transcriptional regulator
MVILLFPHQQLNVNKKNMKNRIREFRNQLGITQEDLANRSGVRRETIVFLEQGKYNPSLKLAHDVAEILGVKIEELFFF